MAVSKTWQIEMTCLDVNRKALDPTIPSLQGAGTLWAEKNGQQQKLKKRFINTYSENLLKAIAKT